MNEITKKYLPEYVILYPVDQYSKIPASIIRDCLAMENQEPLDERLLDLWDFPTEFYMKEIKHRMYYDQLKNVFDEDEDEIRDWLYEHDESEPLGTMARQTRIRSRILLYSNHDFFIPEVFVTEFIPHYEHQYRYKDALKEAIDLLAINPAAFKKEDRDGLCRGNWPDIPHRNNPVVSPEEFYDCCVNSNGCMNWGFFGVSEGSFLLETGFKLTDNLVIPKGTNCKWFGLTHGNGSLSECETLRDVTIGELRKNLDSKSEYTKLRWEVDQKDGCSNGYSSEEIYNDIITKNLLKSDKTA